jgi:hypothetical protein
MKTAVAQRKCDEKINGQPKDPLVSSPVARAILNREMKEAI